MFWFRYCQKLKKSRDGICRLLEQFDKISGKLRCLNYFSNALCVNSCVMNIENIVYHCWLFTGIQETWEKRSTQKEALSTVTNRFELQEVQIKRKTNFCPFITLIVLILAWYSKYSWIYDFFTQWQRLMSAAKQKKKESPYDNLRKKTIDAMDEMFR